MAHIECKHISPMTYIDGSDCERPHGVELYGSVDQTVPVFAEPLLIRVCSQQLVDVQTGAEHSLVLKAQVKWSYC